MNYYKGGIRISLDNVVIVLIMLIPMMRYYSVPILDIGFDSFFILAILFICIWFAMIGRTFDIPREMKRSGNFFALYIAWTVAITMFFELCSNLNMNLSIANYNLSGLLFPLFHGLVIIFIFKGCIDLDNVLKIYIWFVNLIAVIYIFQWGLYAVGLKLSFKLPFAFDSDWAFLANKGGFGMNPMPRALFSEKSHLCEYLAPYVAMCLFSETIVEKARIRKAVLFSVIMATTLSGNGIVLLFVMWFMYFVVFNKAQKKNQKVLIGIVGIVALGVVYMVLMQIPAANKMLSQLFVDETGSEFVAAKADYRVYRGLDLFTKLPTYAKITGVGYKHMFIFSRAYKIYSEYDYSWKLYEYFSAVSMVLLYSGLIGTYGCVRHFWALYKAKIKTVTVLVIVMVALWFSAEMLLNYTHVMYVLLISSVLCYEKTCEARRLGMEEELCE